MVLEITTSTVQPFLINADYAQSPMNEMPNYLLPAKHCI